MVEGGPGLEVLRGGRFLSRLWFLLLSSLQYLGYGKGCGLLQFGCGLCGLWERGIVVIGLRGRGREGERW